MAIRKRAVNVLQFPERIVPTSHDEFIRRVEMAVQNGHPRFVLDCSKIESVGSREINFFLDCLEEVMKHNGDIRLAMVDPQTAAVLQTSGLGRLFEVYETIEHAIHSFQVRPASIAPLYSEVAEAAQDSEYAA